MRLPVCSTATWTSGPRTASSSRTVCGRRSPAGRGSSPTSPSWRRPTGGSSAARRCSGGPTPTVVRSPLDVIVIAEATGLIVPSAATSSNGRAPRRSDWGRGPRPHDQRQRVGPPARRTRLRPLAPAPGSSSRRRSTLFEDRPRGDRDDARRRPRRGGCGAHRGPGLRLPGRHGRLRHRATPRSRRSGTCPSTSSSSIGPSSPISDATTAPPRPLTWATIRLADALDLEVVAEGVEDEQQYEHLRALGCHRIQGFHISRPVPSDAILDLLSAWRTA